MSKTFRSSNSTALLTIACPQKQQLSGSKHNALTSTYIVHCSGHQLNLVVNDALFEAADNKAAGPLVWINGLELLDHDETGESRQSDTVDRVHVIIGGF